MAKHKNRGTFANTNNYFDELDCGACLYWQGKVRGCSLSICCCEEENIDLVANDYVSKRLNGKDYE